LRLDSNIRRTIFFEPFKDESELLNMSNAQGLNVPSVGVLSNNNIKDKNTGPLLKAPEGGGRE